MMEFSGATDPTNPDVPDFLEATIYDRQNAVIMVGNFADVDPSNPAVKINPISRWYKPWFYKRVECFLSEPGEELIPGHSREGLLAPPQPGHLLGTGVDDPLWNHPHFRFLLGWICPPKPAFLKFTTTTAIREMTFAKQVFQDIVMPLRTLKEQVNTAEELFDAFPLLVYPCRIYANRQGQLRSPPTDLLVKGTDYAMFNDL